jgi:glycosyltransferase involved in cell wall biosynthesis
MNKASVYIIVPAYNEQEVLFKTISALLTTSYSVVVVDDGSTINLKECIKELPVYFLQHQINLGQGAALQTGNEFALKMGAEFIIHFDADGQHQFSDIEKLLLPIINEECDITLGSRFLHQQTTKVPFSKRAIIFSARYLNYMFTGILLSDAHNGLRAMNKKAAELMVLTENRMSHASEILFLIKKHKLKIEEVPVSILYTEYSKQKGQSIWNSIRILFDLLLHKLFQ